MDILIEELDGSLLTAALLNGRIEGFEVDPIDESVRWGSIYRAKVKTLDPARDAAFLDLGDDLTGLIYNKDIRIIDETGKAKKGGEKAISKTLSPGDMITVQAKTAYTKRPNSGTLTGENKLPQMSMDVTLPGRYLIYAPMLDRTKISSRIRDESVRGLIRTMMRDMNERANFIIRASAAFTQTDMLVQEAKFLKSLWQTIFEQHSETDEPRLLKQGANALERSLSDHAARAVQTIEVTTMDHLDLAEQWCALFAPDLMPKITPVELSDASEDLALFYERDVIGQIESLFDSYIMMNGGGSIIIQSTAALTAIDVNTGGDKRGHLAVNIEAVNEIARHIRLRNIGGAIVIDALKLKNKKEMQSVLEALEAATLKDPCTIQIHGVTGLGMIEMTRKRRTPPLDERFALPFM